MAWHKRPGWTATNRTRSGWSRQRANRGWQTATTGWRSGRTAAADRIRRTRYGR